MRVTRRAFLVSALGVTTGCVGVSSTAPASPTGGASSPTPTTTPTGTPRQVTSHPTSTVTTTETATPTLETPRSVSLGTLTQRKGGDTLTAEATLLEDTITTAHPARLRVTITADTPRTVTYTDCPPGDLHAADSPRSENQLLLSTFDPDTDTASCWHLSRAALNMGRPCLPREVRVTPDDPFTRTYTIWDDRDNTACYPPGEYHGRFKVAQTTEAHPSYRWLLPLQLRT